MAIAKYNFLYIAIVANQGIHTSMHAYDYIDIHIAIVNLSDQ